MSLSLKSNASSPYGYGANNLKQLQLYLNRNVKQICFSSEEDLYASKVIVELQHQIQQLESEIQQLKQQKVIENTNIEPKILEIIKEQSTHERTLDSQRLYYCMTNEVFMVEGNIYANLESEPVVDNDFRAALDRLVGHRYINI
jgi:vacuolar-type H+-ATPase subunit I/STV1